MREEIAAKPDKTPTRPRFFYGWVIVGVSSLADLVSFSAGAVSFGVFLRPMSEGLGWSRTVLAGAPSAQSLVNALISPVLGQLVDRFDPRFIMVTGTVIAAIAYALMGGITEPWQFYVLYTAATALGLHEVGSFVTNVVVSKWFVRMRGRAIALTSLSNQVGALFVVPLVAYLVANLGWRTAWQVLGVGLAIVLLPPISLFMRRTPEDMGLRPDGDPPYATPATAPQTGERAAQPVAPLIAEPHWGPRDALRTRTTWLLIAANNTWSLSASVFLVHQLPYFMDSGLSLQAASFVVALNNLVTIFAKAIWGFVAERVPPRYCLTACYLLRAVGIGFLVLGTGIERVYFYAVIAGFAIAFAPLTAQMWADYYGRASVGSIRGIVAPFNVFASLGGGLFAARTFDVTGSYEGAFIVCIAGLLIGAVIMLMAKPPGPAPVRDREAARP